MNINLGLSDEVTLLSEYEIFDARRIDPVTERRFCKATDFSVFLGGKVTYNWDNLKSRKAWYWTRGLARDNDDYVAVVTQWGLLGYHKCAQVRTGSIRPAIPFSNISAIPKMDGYWTVSYGEFPQDVVDTILEKTLDCELSAGTLNPTGKTYTTDSRPLDAYSESFKPRELYEYEYNGEKYVKAKYEGTNSCLLSNYRYYRNGDEAWFEVSPINWIISEDIGMIFSERALVSGIRFNKHPWYDGNFNDAEMYMVLNTYFAKDIIPTNVNEMTSGENIQFNKNRKCKLLMKEYYNR